MSWRSKKSNRRVRKETIKPSLWSVFGMWLSQYRRIIISSLMVVAVTGSAWQLSTWLQGVEGLTIQQVRVEGSFENLDREEVGALIKPYAGHHFFDIDVVDIRAGLERQAWVQSASVRREWPDTLVVSLIEQRPVARWGKQGLLSHKGVVFYPDLHKTDALEGLPLLDGVTSSERSLLERLHQVTEILQPLGMKVVSLQMDARRSWRIELDNGLQLMLGREQDMQRIQRFLAFYPLLLAQRLGGEVAVVDLRYSRGFAVRWTAAPDKDVTIG